MSKAVKFDTVFSGEVEIDPEMVRELTEGNNEASTRIVVKEGEDVVVLGTELEVAARLGLNPLEVVDPENDDESMEDLVDHESELTSETVASAKKFAPEAVESDSIAEQTAVSEPVVEQSDEAEASPVPDPAKENQADSEPSEDIIEKKPSGRKKAVK